jgi:hypothetical protein
MTLKLLTSEGGFVRFEALGKISRDSWTQHNDPLIDLCGDDIYQRKCLLSLNHALYIDSTGVEWLLTAHRRFQAGGGMLILHSLTAAGKQLLKIMRMHLVLQIADNERKALELAAGPQKSNVDHN